MAPQPMPLRLTETEQGALDDPCSFLQLYRRKINPADPVQPLAMFSGVFFRPEEDRFFSEGVDDAFFLKF